MTPDQFQQLVDAGMNVEQIGVVNRILAESEAAMRAAEEARKAGSRERVQRWRDKNRQGVTLPKRNGNATVPLTRAEGSSSNKVISGKEVSASPTAPPKRATRLPADWVIPEDWLLEAIAAGLSRQRALSEAERMKNWSLSNRNGAKLDWLASWRNWYRDKVDSAQQPRAGPSPPLETVGSLSKRQLFEQRSSNAPDNATGRVVQIDARRLEDGPGAPRAFAVSSNLLGRI